MTTIYKLAARFQNKLVLTAANAFDQITKARKAAYDLFLTKRLWENSAAYEPTVSSPIDEINSLSYKWYSNAKNYGLTGSQNADYLAKLNDQVAELESAEISAPLDPSASNKLGAFKAALYTIVPVAIPAQNVQVLPEQTIVGDQPNSTPDNISGAAYKEDLVEPGQFSPRVGPLVD